MTLAKKEEKCLAGARLGLMNSYQQAFGPVADSEPLTIPDQDERNEGRRMEATLQLQAFRQAWPELPDTGILHWLSGGFRELNCFHKVSCSKQCVGYSLLPLLQKSFVLRQRPPTVLGKDHISLSQKFEALGAGQEEEKSIREEALAGFLPGRNLDKTRKPISFHQFSLGAVPPC